MDKAEYKIATEHIKKLISQGEYAEASHIADTIDWRRVKSVMMLCTVSDLYKVNRRYEDAKELLYMAYERNPESRTILYSLCDLSIKLEEFVAAIEYYKSFVEVAPRDTGRYVLQYRLYQAQDVSLEERIEVLEQLKREEYIEKWAYELAYLYHRIGFATKCVEECDELILWFGKGRYVYKAMELKMLHEPLTPSQQYIYDRRFEHLEQAKDMTRVLPRIDSGDSEMTDEGMVDVTDAPTVEIPQEYIEKELQEEVEEIQVKTLDVANAYNTMNLQKELADSLREILEVSHTESSVDNAMGDNGDSEYADTAEMERDLEEKAAAMNAEKDAEEAAERATEQAEAAVEAGRTDALDQENSLESEKEDASHGEPVIWAEPTDITLAAVKAAVAAGTIKVGSAQQAGSAVQVSAAEAEEVLIEKQITGQLSIEDVLAEWDKHQEESLEAHQEDISNRIKSQTQDIFAAIEAEMQRDLYEDALAADKAEQIFGEEVQLAAEPEETMEEALEEVTEPVEEVHEEAVELNGEALKEAADLEEVLHEETADLEEEGLKEAEGSINESFVESFKPIEEVFRKKAGLSEAEVDEQAQLSEETLEEAVEQKDEAASESEETLQKEQDSNAVKAAAERDEKQEKSYIKESVQTEALDEDSQADSMNFKKYGPFIRSVDTEVQIMNVLDNVNMDAKYGNISVTGHDLGVCFDFIKLLLSDLKKQGLAIAGKTAKISAVNLNKKEPSEIISKVQGGILIIERASRLRRQTTEKLMQCLGSDVSEVLIFLTDNKQGMNRFFDKNNAMYRFFNLRVDIKDYTSEELIEHAVKYALEQEYSIDEMGLLALRTRIDEMIANDEALTLEDAEDIINEAIDHVNAKTFRHFLDILLRKRYDEEDMIILREEDFF